MGFKVYLNDRVRTKIESSSKFGGTTSMSLELTEDLIKTCGLEAVLTRLGVMMIHQAANHRFKGRKYVGVDISGMTFSYIPEIDK